MLSNPGSAIQYACYPKHPQNWQRTKPKRKLCDILLDLPQRWHELSTSTQGHLSTSYKSSWLPYLLLWNPRKSLDSKFLLDISPPKLVYFPRLDKHMLATSYWNFIFAIPTDCSKIWPRIWQGINKKLTDLPFPWSPSCHTEELNQDSICNFTTLTSSQTLEWFCGHSCSLSQDPKTWPVRIWQPALKKSNSVWSGSHISQPLPSLLVKSVLPSQRWRQDKSTLPPRTFHHLLQAGISPCLSCVFLLFLWLKKKKNPSMLSSWPRPVVSPPRALPTAQITSPVNYYSRLNAKVEISQEETKLAFYPTWDDSHCHLGGPEGKTKTWFWQGWAGHQPRLANSKLNAFASKTQSRKLSQIMGSRQLRFLWVNSPLQRRGPPYVSSAPPQCPLHSPQHPALPFSRICNPIPPKGSPCLCTAPISCPWWLLWSLLFPWSLGQRKLSPHPWGPAYPQHPARELAHTTGSKAHPPAFPGACQY